jgi:RNA polymerase sigma-70 factor (ECF subfamily)
MLGAEDEAMDASQDVFVRFLKSRQVREVEFPSSFLYVTATRVCLNRIRDRARHGETSDEQLLDRIATLEDTEDRVGAGSVLGRLFGRSPASSRTIAVLHYLDGFTLEETAREVGMSVSGVRKRLRALRKLAEWIERS